MKRLALFAVALVAVALVRADHPVPAPLNAPPPTAFECRFTDAPPDEAAWKGAQPITSFHLPWLGDKARMGRTATTAKLLWDREYLYFAADMEDSHIVADITEHDGDLWKNDVFELFLRPADKPGYYEFQVSANGTRFDAFYPKWDFDALDKQKKVGEFHMTSKVTKTAKGWAVEGRIPWADFLRTGGRPLVGETWKMNLARFDYHKDWKEPELSCVAPIKAKKLPAFFHQTDDYATVTFTAPTAGREPVDSKVVGFPDPPPPFRVKRVLDKYRPAFPICVAAVPGTDQMLAITQKQPYSPSTLVRFKDSPDTTDAVKILDTPDGGTAYDIAFHPKFAENGFVYVGWNGPLPGRKGKWTVVTRYTMQTKAPFDFDVKSAANIIDWQSDGHNGGAICFGHDGLLYVTSGDGTSDSDTNLTGQRTDLLLAKVLRIDVDRPADGKQYSVPKDNPFVGKPDFAPETWAMGLRNPWRITCDARTGHIWVGNNGQDLWEQAYFIRKGENYGWSVMEGGHAFYPNRKAAPLPLVKPTVEHHHSEARSLTGGVVYHGDALPELRGAYVYGDHSTGRIWAVKHDGSKVTWHKEVAVTPLKITGFALDARGELMICDHNAAGEGGFYTLEPNPAKHDSTFPRTLSASGLFADVKTHTLKPGVVPYSVNAPFWSDGLHKERFFALPGGETITYHRGRSWDFPDKTVLIKSFAVEEKEGDPASRKWVETRFMTKQGGEWFGYSYLWNDAGTDATLVDAKGLDREFTIRTPTGDRKQTWHYPSRAECMVCHTRAANFVLGLCEPQLNKGDQLARFEKLGVLKANIESGAPREWADAKKLKGKDADEFVKLHAQQPGQRESKPGTLLPLPPDKLKRYADPYDKSQDLTLRARAWLQVNCASCHVEAGGGNAQMNLEFATALEKMKVVGEKPMHTTFDLADARLIAPGHPERSVMLHRIGLRGTGQMPPLSTNRVDVAGVELMREWCKALGK